LAVHSCLRIGYRLRKYRKAITVTLTEPGKKYYTDAAAYRPIALLNTLGKILESIIASADGRGVTRIED